MVLHQSKSCVKCYNKSEGRWKLFYNGEGGGVGGELSKNVGHHGWPTTKNKKSLA